MAAGAGCAPVSSTPSEIDRFVDAPRDALVRAFDQAASARGYRGEGGTYERITQYRRDPVLGLVKISDDPTQSIILRPEIIASGESAARLRLAPQRLLWLWPYAGKQFDYWTPGSSEYAEAVGIVDAAVAEATAAHRQQNGPPGTPRR